MPILSTRREMMHSSVVLGCVGLFAGGDSRGIDASNGVRPFRGGRLSDFHESPAPYPTDPLIMTMGGEFSLSDEMVTEVVSLHPDVISGQRNNTQQFGAETGIPVSRQRWLSALFDEYHIERSEELREEHAWTYPDGRPVEEAVGIVAEAFDGRPHMDWDDDVLPSVFAPGTVDLVQAEVERYLDRGHAAIQVGNVRIPRLRGLDFSIWARAAFEEHLERLPESRRQELDVQNLNSFDIREYIESEGIQPGSSTHPAEDPLVREYLLFHHKGVKEFLSSINVWISDEYPERAPPFYLDQPIGDPYLWDCAVAETYASEHVDLISMEDYRTMPASDFGLGGNPDRPVPEKDIRDFVYKLMLATGRNETPVFGWDTFGGSYYSDVSSEDSFPRLLRLQAAEAYAMGCRRRLARRDAPMSWRGVDGELPTELREFIDFLWSQQRFLRNTEPANQVALIWSLPTLLWNTFPQWYINAATHTNAFMGNATLLRESQLLYDVFVFGHPELMPDGDYLRHLPEYDAVILPAVESITGEQLTALQNVISEGGIVVTTGSPPSRTGDFEPTDGDFEVFEMDGAVNLEPDPGLQRLEGPSGGEELVQTLERAGLESALNEPDGSIGVNLLAQPTDGRYLLHLLNYDYDPDSDEFNEKGEFEVHVDITEDELAVARYYSPQRIQDLDVQKRDGRYAVTVPELTEWGFVAMAPREERLADPGSEQLAESRISEAKAKLQKVRETDAPWTPEFVRAGVEVRSAQRAFDYEAYSLAIEVANWVVHLAESVLPAKTSTPERTSSPTHESTPDDTRTTSLGQSPTHEPTQGVTRTTAPGQPGFDAIQALLGVSGAAYLMRDRLPQTSGDTDE